MKQSVVLFHIDTYRLAPYTFLKMRKQNHNDKESAKLARQRALEAELEKRRQKEAEKQRLKAEKERSKNVSSDPHLDKLTPQPSESLDTSQDESKLNDKAIEMEQDFSFGNDVSHETEFHQSEGKINEAPTVSEQANAEVLPAPEKLGEEMADESQVEAMMSFLGVRRKNDINPDTKKPEEQPKVVDRVSEVEVGEYVILVTNTGSNTGHIINRHIKNNPLIEIRVMSGGTLGVYIDIKLLKSMPLVGYLKEIFAPCDVEQKGRIISVKGEGHSPIVE